MIKKFKCTVERTDEYIIEIDDEIINEKWMKKFREVFFNFHTLEEHAEQIAQMRARFQKNFIEGYGVPLFDGKNPNTMFYKDKDLNKAINIIIKSEDENCNVDVEEIE